MKIKKCVWINLEETHFVKLRTEAARGGLTLGELVHEYILLGLKWTWKTELDEQLSRDSEKARQELEAVQAELDALYLRKKLDERNRKQRAYRLRMKKLKRAGRKLPGSDNKLGTADNEPGTT
jgi:hypothetical protein